jgi:hypothetical protein
VRGRRILGYAKKAGLKNCLILTSKNLSLTGWAIALISSNLSVTAACSLERIGEISGGLDEVKAIAVQTTYWTKLNQYQRICMEPINAALLLIINIASAFPISSVIFEMVRVFKNDVNFQKKGSIRWLVFFGLISITVWFYLVYSSLFHWRF